MELGLLAVYPQTQHRKETGGRHHQGTTAPRGEPRTYKMTFPTAGGGPRNFPVERCRGRVETRTTMQVHFLNRHVRYTVIMLGEGNLPHPQCPWCNILVPRRVLNGRHLTPAQCA